MKNKLSQQEKIELRREKKAWNAMIRLLNLKILNNGK